MEKCEASALTVMANIKQSPNSGWINTEPHIEGLLNSVPITQYIMSGFQQKTTRHAKGKKKTF